MKTKILFIVSMTMTLSFAQTSKTEINQIIKEQSDGIITSLQKGVSTVYNDGTSIVKTVYNDAKSLSPKIESAIKSLATELKTTTDALWVILVKQQLIWSICFLILTLTSLFNWFIFYKRNFKKLNDDDFVIGKKVTKTGYSSDPVITTDIIIRKDRIFSWFIYIHLIICLGLSGLSIYHFSDMLTGFINPEFGALKTIAEIAIKLK